jgi:hypothetical protein
MTGVVLAAATLLADAASAECLGKAVPRPDGTSGKDVILAPHAEVPKYSALGYRVQACTADVEQLSRGVEMLCAQGASTNPALRQSADARRGVSFSDLCASARAAVAEMKTAAARKQ